MHTVLNTTLSLNHSNTKKKRKTNNEQNATKPQNADYF